MFSARFYFASIFFSYWLALKICCCHSFTFIHSHSFAANAANIQFLGKFIDLPDVCTIGSIILYAPHSLGIHVITLYLLIVIIGRVLSARTSRTFICRNAMSFVCHKDVFTSTNNKTKQTKPNFHKPNNQNWTCRLRSHLVVLRVKRKESEVEEECMYADKIYASLYVYI